jgi:hypothetical protein
MLSHSSSPGYFPTNSNHVSKQMKTNISTFHHHSSYFCVTSRTRQLIMKCVLLIIIHRILGTNRPWDLFPVQLFRGTMFLGLNSSFNYLGTIRPWDSFPVQLFNYLGTQRPWDSIPRSTNLGSNWSWDKFPVLAIRDSIFLGLNSPFNKLGTNRPWDLLPVQLFRDTIFLGLSSPFN